MKVKFAVASLFSLALASAPARAETTLLQDHFKGDQVFASFGQDTPIDCGEGFIGSSHIGIFISAGSTVQRGDFGVQNSNQVQVLLFTRNSCTGESGFGSEVLTDNAFHISAQQKATIHGSVFLSDLFTSNGLGLVSFDLNFTGVGTISRNESHGQFQFGDIRVVQHSVGANRDVTVAGSITFNGQELIGGFQSGAIGKTRSGTIETIRN
jgi:hypothetical protein